MERRKGRVFRSCIYGGTIALKSSELIFKNNTLKGGSFVIDMTTIACTDLTGEYKRKLEGHLKSDDFFSVSSLSNL